MHTTAALIDRALMLAATGKYRTATQLRVVLQSEGFARNIIQPLFDGGSFKAMIRARLRAAFKPSPPEAVGSSPSVHAGQ